MMPCAGTLLAQNKVVKAASVPMLMQSWSTRTANPSGQLLKLDVVANREYNCTTDAGWVKVIKENGGVLLDVSGNLSAEDRTATLRLETTDGSITRTMTLTQPASDLVEKVQGSNELVKVVSATDNTHQDAGCDISKAIDGDLSTMYHSNWTADVWPEHPATLIFNFKDVDRIDYINYIPRASGANGRFRELEIWYKTKDNDTYQKLGDYDFKGAGSPTSVSIEGGILNPTAIKFLVKTAAGDAKTVNGVTKYLASCAEMQFLRSRDMSADFDVFADNLYTALKPGVTKEQVNHISDPLAYLLAQQLIDNKYSLDYRVQRFNSTLSPGKLGELLHIGDGYTYYQNPLGIVFKPGKHIVIARGIPSGQSVSLTVKKWYDPDNVGQNSESYVLTNGVNVIEKKTSWTGLGYIAYFTDTPDPAGEVDIHVVNGLQNGFYDLSKSNDDWDRILANAKYPIMDIVGNHAQVVFPVAELQTYAPHQGRWLTNVYDSIVCWEQHFCGFDKYNRMPTPRNRIMARVNYNYYMFRDGDGVAFMGGKDGYCMNRVCSPTRLTQNDDDACWGMSHEWGHVHQLQPYFSWGGLGETSNNMNSAYNHQRMGYTRVIVGFDNADRMFFRNTEAGKVSPNRRNAYQNASLSTNSALCLAMKDSVIKSTTEDPDLALSYLEVGVFDRLVPFWRLNCYMTQVKNDPDYYPDLYEMLRNTETDTDEYSVKATEQKRASKYANVVPFELNFVRKASIRAGVNLYRYFEDYGFFRTIALRLDDYGNYFYLMDKKTRDDFKAHMDALVADGTLQPMTDEMLRGMESVVQVNKPAPDWNKFKD